MTDKEWSNEEFEQAQEILAENRESMEIAGESISSRIRKMKEAGQLDYR